MGGPPRGGRVSQDSDSFWFGSEGKWSSGLGHSAVLDPLFSASGVGAGVGRCVFGCGLVLLLSRPLFVGLHLDLGLCCAWSEKSR